MIKPGIKTSELYVTVGFALGSILVVLNVLTQEQVNEFIPAFVNTVIAVTALISSVVTIVTYIKGRVKIKSN